MIDWLAECCLSLLLKEKRRTSKNEKKANALAKQKKGRERISSSFPSVANNILTHLKEPKQTRELMGQSKKYNIYTYFSKVEDQNQKYILSRNCPHTDTSY